MKFLSLLAVIFALGLTLTAGDAEAAKRFGGGKSFGMQRQSSTFNKQNAAPAPNQATAPSAAKSATPGPQAAPAKRSWMGPLAGLAAGLGLAALASHLGFGEGLASIMMIALLAMVAMAVIGFFMRRRAAAQGGSRVSGLQYATAGANPSADVRPFEYTAPVGGGSSNTASTTDTPTGAAIPADFDADAFVRNAKVNFIRLQAAHDAGNLDDIREFTTPEMFAEIKMNLSERGNAAQQTDVVTLDAEVVEVVQEATRYIVSVRFTGLIREDKDATPEAIDEIWHLTKATSGSGGWVVAGIQQTQ
ncbi:Tim44 domain-containing protein [Propionivibrio limicola]|uniref:Tim44 domain-containing protein n=1 Tax=Propionivibrio limicola TaxID=167645 RepID=UPI0012925467|nr:TIM44-like domain-containing protein [Propionivibrio limicola]